jgi:hypothetical protein
MPSASKILGDLVSSAGAISVTSGVANTAITGTITTAQIADSAITTAKVAASAILTADIADANVTDAKIVGVANTKITGNIISSQITSVANTQITGRMTASQIANTAVTAGVYGGSSNSALITIDAQGRVTAASNVTASGYSGPQGFQVFNAPGTLTLPPGITSARVTAIGGAGGNGGSTGEGSSGGNGAPGGIGIKRVTGLSAPVAVTVGSGGNDGVTAGNVGPPGNAGGTTSFGPFFSATGGNGGIGSPFNSPPGANGNAGAAPGADVANMTAISFYQAGNYGINNAGRNGILIVEF